jgi:hypothetical protein
MDQQNSGSANVPKTDAEHRSTFTVEVEGDLAKISFLRDYASVEHNLRAAVLLAEDCEGILNANPGKIFKALVDISNLGGTIGYLNKEIRDVYSKLMDDQRIGKIAFFGANMFYEVAVKLMISAMAMRDKVKIFGTKEDALKWLRS